jgi:hypothetical protein
LAQPHFLHAKDNAPCLTLDEYFAWEATQLEKHEYMDGKVYAISGGKLLKHFL